MDIGEQVRIITTEPATVPAPPDPARPPAQPAEVPVKEPAPAGR